MRGGCWAEDCQRSPVAVFSDRHRFLRLGVCVCPCQWASTSPVLHRFNPLVHLGLWALGLLADCMCQTLNNYTDCCRRNVALFPFWGVKLIRFKGEKNNNMRWKACRSDFISEQRERSLMFLTNAELCLFQRSKLVIQSTCQHAEMY